MIPLGEVIEFRNEIIHPKDQPQGVVTFVGLEHIERDTGVRIGSEKIQLEEMTGRRAHFRAGDIIYGYLRPYLNKVWIAEFDGICSVDQYVFNVRETADRNYIAHFLRSAEFLKTAPVESTPGQLPRIRSGEIAETLVPLPPLDEQRRIAAILDQADDLRRKRREALKRTDALSWTVFDQLIGDPVRNPNRWPQAVLKDATNRIQIGPFGSLVHKDDYVSDGVPLINPMHIQAGTLYPDSKCSVSSVKHLSLDLYHLHEGDIVMGRRGEMGRCAIVQREQDRYVCGTGSLFIRPNEQIAIAMYLYFVLSSGPIKKQLEDASLGATLPNLNNGIVESLTVPLPPLDLQRAFAARVTEIDALKAQHRAHLAKLDALFASLQHRAFRGEL
jgi:type I restriction enzyme S subunit